MKNQDEELRKMCLQLALSLPGEQASGQIIIQNAKLFYDYIKGNNSK